MVDLDTSGTKRPVLPFLDLKPSPVNAYVSLHQQRHPAWRTGCPNKETGTMEFMIYVANGMYVASYFMKDILRLRILSVLAASCLIAYFYCRAEPMMTVVYWNLFFVGVNTFQVARIFWTRVPARTVPV
jgi:hypothetical protein